MIKRSFFRVVILEVIFCGGISKAIFIGVIFHNVFRTKLRVVFFSARGDYFRGQFYENYFSRNRINGAQTTEPNIFTVMSQKKIFWVPLSRFRYCFSLNLRSYFVYIHIIFIDIF